MRRSTTAVTLALALALAGCGANGDDGETAPPEETTGVTASPTETPTDTASPTETPSETGSPTETDDGDDGATGEPTAGPAPETEEPTDAGEWSTDPQNDPAWPGGGSGQLLPTALRAGTHDGFERIVIDFEGEGEPGWGVEYVDAALEHGSGNEVDVDGDATLQIVATGVRIPEEGEDVIPHREVDVEETDLVDEAYVTGIFEGQLQIFLGLDDERPFRVFPLSEPTRLVVDIRTS